VRVGIEATGHTRWFERMLAELGHELWIGDAAQIRASVVRKQKTDARDAAHLLELLRSERFPRIWRPTMAERDLRQLVWHRQKLVWMRNAVGNQLHALAGGYKPIIALFNRKSQNQKCKRCSSSADFVALRKTLRNTRV
jgi:transposase